ncbi:hypothetical protein, unknown function [Leishmania tarentolae]|uniref:Uncharacterized protein n=1 Tax=Leishmania tarentolae TaxID=5689 RepID=A0A640KN51_LEITA|nr:hypothetical protein, unknown function [Leishmania tarentolae]
MTHPVYLATPPGTTENISRSNGGSQNWRSLSAVNSSSSYTRWQYTRRPHGSDRSALSHSPGADAVSTSDAEASAGSLSTVTQSQRHRKRDDQRSSSEQNISAASESQHLGSVEEQSFRYGLPESAATSTGELPLRGRSNAEELDWRQTTVKSGENSRRRSQASIGAVNRKQREVHMGNKRRDMSDTATPTASLEVCEVTVAIAEAVPRIAQEQVSATEAYTDRWSHELQQSTATEEELRRLYQQLEKELIETRSAANAAEERHKRELELLKRQLEQERTERIKAEKDREDLLAQATQSPSYTPRTGCVSPSAEYSADIRGSRSLGASPSSGYVSDVFYDKLKEREERARARVRKEFVRQAQENLYAEQRKRAEAEKATEMNLKRLEKAEEDMSKAQEALQEATSVLEAKDVQLHERAIHVQELEAHVHLLKRQLAAAEDAARVSSELAAKNLEEVQALADQRQAELEAQRQFVHQLQEKIGLTTLNLFDRENDQEAVLRTVHELRARCRQLEEEFAVSVQDATALLEQRGQRAEDEAQLLRGRNEELKERCAVMAQELAELKTRQVSDNTGVAQLRARHEKALSECHVEIRSLQLQLERFTDAAKRRSSESATAKEIEQQQNAALVRQYAAEARALQEELDRVKARSDLENEKHLETVLDLSQQITALKQANTELEHAINIRERESTEATRLLGRANEELSQFRDQRRRMSITFSDHREDSRSNSAVGNYDALLRRIAELENAKEDLTKRLQAANATVERLQTMQQITDDRSRSNQALSNNRHHRRRSKLSCAVPPTDSFLQLSEEEGEHRQAGRHAVASAPLSVLEGTVLSAFKGRREPATSLVDVLEPIAQQLEAILRGAKQQGESVAQRKSSPLPEEPRAQQCKQTEELEALDRVLVSCMAALECCHLRRTSSPFYSPFRDAEAGKESKPAAIREGKAAGREAPSSSVRTSVAGSDHADTTRSRSSSAACRSLRHGQDHRNVVQHTTSSALPPDHFPQVPLERPRRSSQRSHPSFRGEHEFLLCLSNTSAADPHLLLQKTAHGDAAAGALQRAKQECMSAVKRLFNGSDAVHRIERRISAPVRKGNREVLQSESFWEGDDKTEMIVQGECVAPSVSVRFSSTSQRTTESPSPRPHLTAAVQRSRGSSGGTEAKSNLNPGSATE